MPKNVSSPFSPGQPVPLEFFVGRMQEIEQLRSRMKTAQSGRLQVAFLSGERGIGKSSLAMFVRFFVERTDNVLGLHAFLGGVSSLDEMVRRVFDRLVKDSIGRRWHQKVKDFLGNRVRQVGLFGISVEFDAQSQDLRRLVSDFAPALRNLARSMKDECNGMLLILDDINGLVETADFANWLKSLVDEIATSREPLPLFLLLVGLEERRAALVNSQPSLARVFDLVDLKAWSDEETRDFYKNAFQKVGTTVDEGARGALANFAGGLPVLAHEIGDAVFAVDTDNHITTLDAMLGITQAADIVGRKYLHPSVFEAIRSPRYRAILRKMTGRYSFRRAGMLTLLDDTERRVSDNFLRKMVKLGVLIRDAEKGAGHYHFANLLHYLYFQMEATGARRASS